MKRLIFGIICVLVLAAGCGKKENSVKVSSMGEYFGTVLTITLYGENEEQLSGIIADAFAECGRMEKIFSAKREDSELSELNNTAWDRPMTVSEELCEVIGQGLFYNEITDGALDISMGRLISLWGIGSSAERIPDENEITAYAGRNGCQDISLDTAQSTIRFTDDLVQIDLGAIAKGYCAGQIKQYLLDRNPKVCGILDFGGNIVTIGCKRDGSAWNIGITDPKVPSRVCASVSVKDMCVVTSGNYERYFEQDGVRYHHILDPKSGYPAANGIISATIIGADSMQCDAMSTACFILGVEKAMALVEDTEGLEAVLIDDDGQFHCSSGMEKYYFQKR